MHIEIDLHLSKLLQELAAEREQDLDTIVNEALTQYLKRQTFDDNIRRIIADHKWLLDRLAE